MDQTLIGKYFSFCRLGVLQCVADRALSPSNGRRFAFSLQLSVARNPCCPNGLNTLIGNSEANLM